MKNNNKSRDIKSQKARSTPVYSDIPAIPGDIRRIAEFVEFARWFALPSWEREPKTQKEFAETIGVSEDTLTDWKKREEFLRLVFKMLRELMMQRAPDIAGGIYNKIASGKGSVNDIRAYFSLATGDFPRLK